jgi:hypothetical protein
LYISDAKIGSTVALEKNEQLKSMPPPPPGGFKGLAEDIIKEKRHMLLKFGRDIIAVRTRKFDHYFSSEPLPTANGSSSSSSPKKSNLKKRKNAQTPSPEKRVRIAVPNSSTTWTQQTVGEYTVYIGKPYLTEEEFKQKDNGEVATVEDVTIATKQYKVQVSNTTKPYSQKMFHGKFKTREEWEDYNNNPIVLFENELRALLPKDVVVSRRDNEDPEDNRFANILKRREHVVLFIWHENDNYAGDCANLYDDSVMEFKGDLKTLMKKYEMDIEWDRLDTSALIVSKKSNVESASSSSSGSSSSKKSDDSSDDVSSSPYVKVSKEIQIDKDWPRIYAKENGRYFHVTHGVSEQQDLVLDFTTFKKDTIQTVTVESMNNFTLYGVDIGPAEEGADPPTTVVVHKKEKLALSCFKEKVYTTKSKLLQFAKAEVGMKCESVKVYDGDRYNNTYDDIGTAIRVYNGQHVENQVIVFFMGQKATSVSSSSSSSSNLQGDEPQVILAAKDVTEALKVCVLDGKAVTYLGKDNDGDNMYTDPHENTVQTIGGKHFLTGTPPPTKTPRKKKRKRGPVVNPVVNPFPGWLEIPKGPKYKGPKPYIANDKIYKKIDKGNAFFDKVQYVKIHGQGTWMRTDEYERLENAEWDGEQWIFKDESSSSKKQRAN